MADEEGRRAQANPRDHGFSYADEVTTSSPTAHPRSTPARTPVQQSAKSPTSPGTKPMTGFAFTYKPDSPAVSPSTKQTKVSTASSREQFFSSTAGSPRPPTQASSTPRSTSTRPVVTSPDMSGRSSRQSKDSKLDPSSDSESSSSGSLDQYEKEDVSKSRTPKPSLRSSLSNQQQSPSASKFKSPPPQTKPKPSSTSIFDYPSSRTNEMSSSELSTYKHSSSVNNRESAIGPKITMASRKRVVTNADGSTVETEEVLEPSSMTSHSTTTKSKPVVVGTIPSTQPSTVNYSRPESVTFLSYYLSFGSLRSLF